MTIHSQRNLTRNVWSYKFTLQQRQTKERNFTYYIYINLDLFDWDQRYKLLKLVTTLCLFSKQNHKVIFLLLIAVVYREENMFSLLFALKSHRLIWHVKRWAFELSSSLVRILNLFSKYEARTLQVFYFIFLSICFIFISFWTLLLLFSFSLLSIRPYFLSVLGD